MVKSNARLNPAVLVEHVGVQSRVHALAGSTGRERATSTKKRLKRSEGVDIIRSYGEALKGEVDVCKGRQAAEGGRLRRERKEAACVVCRSSDIELRGGGVVDGGLLRCRSRDVLEEGDSREEVR